MKKALLLSIVVMVASLCVMSFKSAPVESTSKFRYAEIRMCGYGSVEDANWAKEISRSTAVSLGATSTAGYIYRDPAMVSPHDMEWYCFFMSWVVPDYPVSVSSFSKEVELAFQKAIKMKTETERQAFYKTLKERAEILSVGSEVSVTAE
jgi:hypothetical protein